MIVGVVWSCVIMPMYTCERLYTQIYSLHSLHTVYAPPTYTEYLAVNSLIQNNNNYDGWCCVRLYQVQEGWGGWGWTNGLVR